MMRFFLGHLATDHLSIVLHRSITYFYTEYNCCNGMRIENPLSFLHKHFYGNQWVLPSSPQPIPLPFGCFSYQCRLLGDQACHVNHAICNSAQQPAFVGKKVQTGVVSTYHVLNLVLLLSTSNSDARIILVILVKVLALM